MSHMPDYKRGRRDGFRFAIQWLHTRAAEMNDPHARAVLNSAAFNLGADLRDADIIVPADASGQSAPSKE